MRNQSRKISKYQLSKIIKYFCVDIEASKTAILLKINRNTINRYFGIFRRLIFENQVTELARLTGTVEMDESYFGASRLRGYRKKMKRGRGTWKQPVFGIFERDGCVYTEIVPNCQKKTLQAIILGKVNPESVIHTDGWRGYDGLVDVGYDKHFRIKHKENEFASKDHHINGIESFWSFTKRRLSKFNGVKINFNLHLKECEWRWHKSINQLEYELSSILKTNHLV
jgi:transposase-like protein